ncbi:hypothetical protein WICPIJ_007201 [Wickerhamomyces pijperi]|uniref:Uncharacterized protein n=1 Tax=Wickerhamomyces pijperi TaxID=599730 RepID=A0A9P8Q0L6_WICPI|nr:hypothetical protein WICPIJ_007201 [Wickerhamomyces pijperi]
MAFLKLPKIIRRCLHKVSRKMKYTKKHDFKQPEQHEESLFNEKGELIPKYRFNKTDWCSHESRVQAKVKIVPKQSKVHPVVKFASSTAKRISKSSQNITKGVCKLADPKTFNNTDSMYLIFIQKGKTLPVEFTHRMKSTNIRYVYLPEDLDLRDSERVQLPSEVNERIKHLVPDLQRHGDALGNVYLEFAFNIHDKSIYEDLNLYALFRHYLKGIPHSIELLRDGTVCEWEFTKSADHMMNVFENVHSIHAQHVPEDQCLRLNVMEQLFYGMDRSDGNCATFVRALPFFEGDNMSDVKVKSMTMCSKSWLREMKIVCPDWMNGVADITTAAANEQDVDSPSSKQQLNMICSEFHEVVRELAYFQMTENTALSAFGNLHSVLQSQEGNETHNQYPDPSKILTQNTSRESVKFPMLHLIEDTYETQAFSDLFKYYYEFFYCIYAKGYILEFNSKYQEFQCTPHHLVPKNKSHKAPNSSKSGTSQTKEAFETLLFQLASLHIAERPKYLEIQVFHTANQLQKLHRQPSPILAKERQLRCKRPFDNSKRDLNDWYDRNVHCKDFHDLIFKFYQHMNTINREQQKEIATSEEAFNRSDSSLLKHYRAHRIADYLKHI